jgi:hypothetical protein
MPVVVFPHPPFWLMMAMIRMANLPWLSKRGQSFGRRLN